MSDPTGRCEHCEKQFSYKIIHNGFNDSAYAYCEKCPFTVLLGMWTQAAKRTALRVPSTDIVRSRGPAKAVSMSRYIPFLGRSKMSSLRTAPLCCGCYRLSRTKRAGHGEGLALAKVMVGHLLDRAK
jgi:hypothetical protein